MTGRRASPPPEPVLQKQLRGRLIMRCQEGKESNFSCHRYKSTCPGVQRGRRRNLTGCNPNKFGPLIRLNFSRFTRHHPEDDSQLLREIFAHFQYRAKPIPNRKKYLYYLSLPLNDASSDRVDAEQHQFCSRNE